MIAVWSLEGAVDTSTLCGNWQKGIRCTSMSCSVPGAFALRPLEGAEAARLCNSCLDETSPDRDAREGPEQSPSDAEGIYSLRPL